VYLLECIYSVESVFGGFILCINMAYVREGLLVYMGWMLCVYLGDFKAIILASAYPIHRPRCAAWHLTGKYKEALQTNIR